MKNLFTLFNSRTPNNSFDYNSFSSRITKHLNTKVEFLNLIDVGANKGRFYDELITIYPKSKIQALLIEPIPDCVRFLEHKFSENKLITICGKAVSDSKQTKEFYIYSFDETSSLLKIKSNLKELDNINTQPDKILKLNTDNLDNIVEGNGLKDEIIDILKIDVQGYEDKVLQGAKKTLKHTKYVWIEVSFKALYDETCLFSDIHKVFTESKFNLLEIADGHRSLENELLQANCLFKNNSLI
jgi:FkbM family methyltransferase